MGKKIDPHLVNLTYEAAFKSFWGKNALRRFLKNCNTSATLLATWSADESKGEFLNRLFQILLKSEKGRNVLRIISVKLSEQKSFPDLHNYEDSSEKIKLAVQSIANLKEYLNQANYQGSVQNDKGEIQPLQYEQRRTEFQTRLDSLKNLLGKKEGEHQFSKWFYDLLDFCNIENKKPMLRSKKPVDGTLKFNKQSFLIDTNFTEFPYEKKNINKFRKSLKQDNENNTGIIISISGYTADAIETASSNIPHIILMNVNHLYLFLTGIVDFAEVINRMHRHLLETGESTISVNKIWLMEYKNKN